MTTRHLGRALVALAAVVATIGLAGAPAAANDAELIGGTLELYEAGSSLLHSQDLGDDTAAIECEAPETTFVTTPSSGGAHEWAFDSSSRASVVIGGQHFTATAEIHLDGTSHTGTGTSTGGGTAAVALALNTSSSCAPIWFPCWIDITGITVVATHDVSSTGATLSDTATISGDNGSHGDFGYEVTASGACGALVGADDGSVTITDAVLHVTS